MRTPNRKRDAVVHYLRQVGNFKFREIGEVFGTSRQRAHQVFERHQDWLKSNPKDLTGREFFAKMSLMIKSNHK